MIKFAATSDGDANRVMIGLGLSRENCNRLLDGLPIMIDVKELLGDHKANGKSLENGRVEKIVIMGGETEAELEQRVVSGRAGVAPINYDMEDTSSILKAWFRKLKETVDEVKCAREACENVVPKEDQCVHKHTGRIYCPSCMRRINDGLESPIVLPPVKESEAKSDT